ncbi:hypothetical protein SDC9_148312 [bioreactor metagenome]|uniref:Uncharacterized protein n=1 Tax=bioreactor metagenome TaxID=1076179 RepID=A0A645EIZ2_9ZZZZ
MPLVHIEVVHDLPRVCDDESGFVILAAAFDRAAAGRALKVFASESDTRRLADQRHVLQVDAGFRLV